MTLDEYEGNSKKIKEKPQEGAVSWMCHLRGYASANFMQLFFDFVICNSSIGVFFYLFFFC